MSGKRFSEKEKQTYRKYALRHAPASALAKDCALSFAVGGFICVIGQAVGDLLRANGLNEETAANLVSVCMIGLSCLLTAFGVYDKIASVAKAGTLVPITGFANAVCACAIDGKSEGFILGVGTGMFQIAGPVIVYGSAASVLYGVFYCLFGR